MRDNNGYTPVAIAAAMPQKDAEEKVNALLKLNPELESPESEFSPVKSAERAGHHDVAKMLRDAYRSKSDGVCLGHRIEGAVQLTCAAAQLYSASMLHFAPHT